MFQRFLLQESDNEVGDVTLFIITVVLFTELQGQRKENISLAQHLVYQQSIVRTLKRSRRSRDMALTVGSSPLAVRNARRNARRKAKNGRKTKVGYSKRHDFEKYNRAQPKNNSVKNGSGEVREVNGGYRRENSFMPSTLHRHKWNQDLKKVKSERALFLSKSSLGERRLLAGRNKMRERRLDKASKKLDPEKLSSKKNKRSERQMERPKKDLKESETDSSLSEDYSKYTFATMTRPQGELITTERLQYMPPPPSSTAAEFSKYTNNLNEGNLDRYRRKKSKKTRKKISKEKKSSLF
eukprot:snap_masked-scaffold_42-processed-gene-1.13-mRNA-1 protein AED:1.00 eAED:1.00 QI:0/0/0/0/1/1/2/0/296